MVVLISKYIPGLYCLFFGEVSCLCLNFPSLFLCSLVSLFLFASKEHHTLFSSSDWLIKFSVRSSRLHSCGNLEHSFIFSVLLFHNWVIVHLCLRMTLSLSFNLSGHFVVLCLGYCQQCSSECWSAWIFLSDGFLCTLTQVKMSDTRLSLSERFLGFFWHAKIVFSKGCWQCPFSPTM